MAPKTQPKKWCDPILAGLFPVLGLILGSMLCILSHKITGTLLDDSEWACSKFNNGDCVQYTNRATVDLKPNKLMKNE